MSITATNDNRRVHFGAIQILLIIIIIIRWAKHEIRVEIECKRLALSPGC